jgi:hypothetical protein
LDVRVLFRESEAVRRRIQALDRDRFEPGSVESVPLSSSCGVAGCDVTVLVVQRCERRGSGNYGMRSVEALVRYRAGGRGLMPSIEVVTIEPREN